MLFNRNRGKMVALVKMLMTARGLNQVEVARNTGVSATAISRYLNESSDLRSDALVKVLNYLGADIDSLVKKEINKVMGVEEDNSLGDDIRYLLDQASPISRKTITDTLIASFKNDKNPDTKIRISKLKKYRDSIKTVRRSAC